MTQSGPPALRTTSKLPSKWIPSTAIGSVSGLIVYSVFNSLILGFVTAAALAAFVSWMLRKIASAPSGNMPPQSELHLTGVDLADLKRRVSRIKFLDNIGNHGETAATQFEELRERLVSLRKLVDDKFDRGEITHDRYLGGVEDVFRSAFANMFDLTQGLLNASLVNVQELRADVKRSEADGGATDASAQKDQLALYERQISQSIVIIDQNRKALVELDRIGVALNEMKPAGSRGSVDLDQALKEIAILSERTRKYSES